MTDLDVLRDRLERLADPSPAPDAMQVIAGARARATSPRRPRRVLVPVAAALVVVAGLVTWREWPDSRTVVVRPPAVELDVRPTTLPKVTVPEKFLSGATVAFDSIWVGTTADGVSPVVRLRAFDAVTGEVRGPVTTPDGNGIWGEPYVFAQSAHHLWVRTTSSGPAMGFGPHPEADNVVYRIDPDNLRAEAVAYLQGDGPLAAYGDRVVVADFAGMQWLDTDGTVVATKRTDEVVGESPGTIPGTNGIFGLHLDARGLWAYHVGRSLILRLDPDTGGRLAAAPSVEVPTPAPARSPVWWFASGPPSGPVPAALVLGVRLDVEGAAAVGAPLTSGLFLQAVDDRRVVVISSSGSAVLDVDNGSISPIGVPDGLDPLAVVEFDGAAFLAARSSDVDGAALFFYRLTE